MTNPIYAQMVSADIYVGTFATQLMQCLCENAAVNPSPPANCCFRVGHDVAQDMGALVDLCCQGVAYVALGDFFAADRFPYPDHTRHASGCTPASYGLELKVGLMRCIPTGDQNFPPSCSDWNNAALQNIYDMTTLTNTACCFRAAINSSDLTTGLEVFVDRQTQASPSGGCVERSMVITVQIPGCYCN